jgi:hypothetical protein
MIPRSIPQQRPACRIFPANPAYRYIAVSLDRLLRYLARCVGGGPIADHRLVRWENDNVTFLAGSRVDEEEDEPLRLFDTTSQKDDMSVPTIRPTAHRPSGTKCR